MSHQGLALKLRLALVLLAASILASAPAPRFAGAWAWAGPQGAAFQITLHEDGTKISGDMTGTAFKGNRVSMGVVSGTRTGNSARLEWSFKDGDQAGPVAGTATLDRVNATLRWKLNYEGKEDCWFPRAAILKRKLR